MKKEDLEPDLETELNFFDFSHANQDFLEDIIKESFLKDIIKESLDHFENYLDDAELISSSPISSIFYHEKSYDPLFNEDYENKNEENKFPEISELIEKLYKKLGINNYDDEEDLLFFNYDDGLVEESYLAYS